MRWGVYLKNDGIGFWSNLLLYEAQYGHGHIVNERGGCGNVNDLRTHRLGTRLFIQQLLSARDSKWLP